jgi:hypothetical protein
MRDGRGGRTLCETEDVVDEQQDVLSFFVAEVLFQISVTTISRCRESRIYLSNGETSKGDTGTGTRGLVHLTEDKGDLGVTVKLNDGSLLHLVVQIVTLTGTLTDTSEDGETTVGLGDVVLPIVS